MSATLMQKLFKWKVSFEYEGIKLYVRIVGDQVIEDGRKHSLLEARRLRRALRDPASDEYLLHLDVMEDLTEDELIDVTSNYASRDIIREFMNNTPKEIVKPPGDNPSQEELEEYEAAKLEREEAYAIDLSSHVNDWRTNFKQILKTRGVDYTKLMYRKHKTDRVCEDAFSAEYEGYIMSNCIYEDADYKKRALTLEEYKSAPTAFKEAVQKAYADLSLSADDLKN